MKILLETWRDGFLDPYCGPGQVRLQVLIWQVLGPVPEAFIRPRRHWRTLVNYWREVGIREVVKKVRSRQSEERFRNRKYVTCGLGRVMGPGGETELRPGTLVVFFAPAHPLCQERVVLPTCLLQSVDAAVGTEPVIRYFGEARAGEFDSGWKAWAGWSEFSGVSLDRERMKSFLSLAAEVFARRTGAADQLLPTGTDAPCEQLPARQAAAPSATALKRAICIGYGQYAKVMLLPNLARGIEVTRIHEIDPTQLGPLEHRPCAVDTAPTIRPDEDGDIFLLAGFHHTHAPLAVEVLDRGAVAIVEKPVATTLEQYERLGEALARHPGKLFACFQKRYSPFNEYIFRDLGVTLGQPISCFCIVYEIPLPAGHWYNWPNSGSRIISNGCHWIDHFLFLNDYAEPTSLAVTLTQNRDYLVSIELANGASLALTLTEQGTPRIGLQEHLEFRANSRTVRIKNYAQYEAEGEDRIVRRLRIEKYLPYRRMYADFSRRILAGLPGDSEKSYHVSTRTVLQVEAALQKTLVRNLTPGN